MKKRILSICSLLLLAFTFFDPSFTNVKASSIVIENAISWAIATANDNSHGYSQSNRWGPDYDCSSFVISAFKNANVNTGSATYTGNMISQFTQNGFKWIPWSQIGSSSNLQRGDVLLKEKGSDAHTEIYLGNNQNVGAHSSRGYPQTGDQTGTEVSVSGYYYHPWDGVLRYTGGYTTKPSNVVLSKNQIWYDIKDTIILTPSANDAETYWMSITKDGKSVVNTQLNGPYSIAASDLGYGEYRAWISAVNSVGSTDSAAIEFAVADGAKYTDIWTTKPIYNLDDTVSISVSTICAKGQCIGIDKEGVGRVITEDCESTYTISARSLGVGKYSAYFSVYNGSGGVDTERVEFIISNPENLGADFYGKIKNIALNKYFTNENSNVIGKDPDCSKSQVWRFVRQSDGTYKIFSVLDNNAMDLKNFGDAGNGTNIQVVNSWDSTAQKFYIYRAYDSYYIKPLPTDLFVDMSLSGDHNVEAWGGSVNWDPQKFEIVKVDPDDIGEHNYGNPVTIPATCTEKGSITYTCSVCGKKKVEVLSALGHTYISTVVKPTATSGGYTIHTCTRCKYTYKSDFTSPLVPPSVVTGVKIGGRAGDALRINWTKNPTAAGYIIEQYKSGKWVRIARIANNATTTYRVEKLNPGTTYKFRIKAFDFKGSTAVYSDYTSVSGKTNPSIMTGVKIGGRAADALRINWMKNSTAAGYIIEQYKNGSWVRIARISGNTTTTYRVEKLSPLTTYQFRIQAFNYDGKTAIYGNYAYVNGKTNPSIMTGVKIGGTAKDALRLNWTKNPTAAGYIIEQYKNGSWVRIARISNNATTTYRVEKLSPSTIYKFRIQPFNFDGSTALYGNYAYVNGQTLK